MRKYYTFFLALFFVVFAAFFNAKSAEALQPGGQIIDLGDDDSDDTGSGAGGGGHYMSQEDGFGDPFDNDSGSMTNRIGSGEDNMGETD